MIHDELISNVFISFFKIDRENKLCAKNQN